MPVPNLGQDYEPKPFYVLQTDSEEPQRLVTYYQYLQDMAEKPKLQLCPDLVHWKRVYYEDIPDEKKQKDYFEKFIYPIWCKQ